MEKQPITFIINGKTFRVRADALEALRMIPPAERQALLELLEAIRAQESGSVSVTDRPAMPAARPTPVPAVTAVPSAAVPPAAVPPAAAATTKARPAVAPVPTAGAVPPGPGDVDELMKRLILEERSRQKPPLQPKTVYLWMGGFFVVAMLLLVLF